MSHLTLNIEGHIASITLCNPEKHNSLSAQDIAEFIALLDQVEQNSQCRVLKINAQGDKTFCAGASFEHIKDQSLRGDAFSELAQKIQTLSIPSVCLANGNIYGGGVELALACDFRIGLEGYHLQVPIAKLGLSYSAYGLKLYHAKLGLSASKRILLATEKLNSNELLRIEFFDTIEENLKAATAKCDDLAKNLASLSPLAVNTMRDALNAIALQEFKSEEFNIKEEKCFASDDKLEGFNALLEKRTAKFKGQ